MGKWWISALAAIGWLGASAAAYAQPVPFLGPQPPPPPSAGPALFQGAPSPAPMSDAPPPAPSAPPPPVIGPGGDRGFDNAFDPPLPGMPPPRYYVDFEYLGAWTKHGNLPILVTKGNVFDPIPGALGQPNTTALIAGPIDDSFHSGGRLTLAYDCSDDRAWRVEVSAFALQDVTTTVGASGSGAAGSPVIARPFFNVNTNTQDADPIAVPGVMSGTVLVQVPQQVFGGEVNAAWNYWTGEAGSWTGAFLFGGRVLSVDEQLLFSQSMQDIPGLGVAGNSYALNENFSTHNYFYGPQLGAAYSWFFGPVTVDMVGKVAVGLSYETLSIGGATQITQPDGTVSAVNRGLLVQPSNAGNYHHDEVAVVPEFLIDAKYDLNDHIRIGAGYDFLYLSRLLRPGDQIDPTINIQALQPFDQVGIARPAVLLNESSFWMQGFSATLELRF